jgi:hypothetical protein
MMRKQIDFSFQDLKSAFPNAKLTGDRKFILVPGVLLPDRFNRSSTQVLISLTKQYETFGLPAVYVRKDLRIRRGNSFRKSHHLDEILTEDEMLRNGWVKLCWYNPPKFKNLPQLMANVILYLERLRA